MATPGQRGRLPLQASSSRYDALLTTANPAWDRVPDRVANVKENAVALALADVIAQLRAELAEAISAGAGEDLRFQVGPVEVELTVAIEKSGTTGAKVKFWVLEAGADGKLASTSTQKIKVVLDPRRAGQPDERPYVSGPEASRER